MPRRSPAPATPANFLDPRRSSGQSRGVLDTHARLRAPDVARPAGVDLDGLRFLETGADRYLRVVIAQSPTPCDSLLAAERRPVILGGRLVILVVNER